jgi:hypothetical protein
LFDHFFKPYVHDATVKLIANVNFQNYFFLPLLSILLLIYILTGNVHCTNTCTESNEKNILHASKALKANQWMVSDGVNNYLKPSNGSGKKETTSRFEKVASVTNAFIVIIVLNLILVAIQVAVIGFLTDWSINTSHGCLNCTKNIFGALKERYDNDRHNIQNVMLNQGIHAAAAGWRSKRRSKSTTSRHVNSMWSICVIMLLVSRCQSIDFMPDDGNVTVETPRAIEATKAAVEKNMPFEVGPLATLGEIVQRSAQTLPSK